MNEDFLRTGPDGPSHGSPRAARRCPTALRRETSAAAEFVSELLVESRTELGRFLAFRVGDRALIDDLAQEGFARFFDNRQRGYLLCDVTHERWESRLRVVDDVRDPLASASTLATLVIESGKVDIR